MKYIKLFENYKNIEDICSKYRIINYTINKDNSVDVDASVYLKQWGLKKLPLQFGKVEGYFICSCNILTSLKGSPYSVLEFNCASNDIYTLKYCPKYIDNYLNFEMNNVHSLNNISKIYFDIYYEENPIDELINLFRYDPKLYLEYLDIYNFQKDNIIYRTRFKDALQDLGMYKLPELKNYIYQ